MTRQVLIVNLNRIGDVVQTALLLNRLHQEDPDVAIDLVVNRPCTPMAALLPGVRQVFADELHAQLGHVPLDARQTAMAQAQDVRRWADPYRSARYDRVINLTFTRRSGLLAAAIGARDTRGVLMTPAGKPIVQNPWFTYVADLLQYRRFNRFNLVDLFAWGGSGHGIHTPIRLTIPRSAEDWTATEFPKNQQGWPRIAVQVGASQPEKRWRPELFGRTMAAISRRMAVEFVLTGTASEMGLAEQAMAAYRAAGGTGPVQEDGRTNLAQLAALLRHCDLLITNDTGTMHVATGVGAPVLNLSVGPVSFWETGPYGPRHWVIQPDLGESAQSGQTGQDQIIPDQVAALARHLLGHAPFPTSWTGVRVYESALDADGLNDYRQRAGWYDASAHWYGMFWRKFWYEEFSQRPSRLIVDDPCPDLIEQQDRLRELTSLADRLVMQAKQVVQLTQQSRPPDVHASTAELATLHRDLMRRAMISPLVRSLSVALNRDLQNGHARTAAELARQHWGVYQTFHRRLQALCTRLDQGADTTTERQAALSHACDSDAPGSIRSALQFARRGVDACNRRM